MYIGPNIPYVLFSALFLAYTNGAARLCRELLKAGGSLATVNRHGVSIFNAQVPTKKLLYTLLGKYLMLLFLSELMGCRMRNWERKLWPHEICLRVEKVKEFHGVVYFLFYLFISLFVCYLIFYNSIYLCVCFLRFPFAFCKGKHGMLCVTENTVTSIAIGGRHFVVIVSKADQFMLFIKFSGASVRLHKGKVKARCSPYQIARGSDVINF